MNKHLFQIIGILTFPLILIFIGILVYDNYLQEQEGSGLNLPNDMGSYRDEGYFKIDPKTILVSLENGETGVFTPLSRDDAFDLEQTTGLTIDWTQVDFLKIASAVGQLVWNNPMDAKDWKVYSIQLEGNCGDQIGFYSAGITYFETGSYGYGTRRIEVEPYLGWVRWGGGRVYPKPILRKWEGVDLDGARISADDALRAVNEDVKAHFQIEDNNCEVIAGSSRFDPEDWRLDILLESPYPILYTVSLNTGDVVRNTK